MAMATDTDCTLLSDYLGAYGGARIKEAGLLDWTKPNSDAKNDAKYCTTRRN
jgi:hypothetical protein